MCYSYSLETGSHQVRIRTTKNTLTTNAAPFRLVPRHLATVDYLPTIRCQRHLLWEFVDMRRLLNQWRNAGDVREGPRARAAIFRDRVRPVVDYRGFDR